MSISVHILGANSAVPNNDRFPTCQCICHDSENILIDCGEGAQINLSRYKLKIAKINTILISHLHGDHVYGLPGLIGSFNLTGRKDPITIVGPQGIKAFLTGVFQTTHVFLNFEINFKELEHDGLEKIIDLKRITIEAFPMKHRVPTYGYKITEKEHELNIDSEAIKRYGLSVEQIKAIKAGGDLKTSDGDSIPNAELTKGRRPSLSYAYCSDTIYDPSLVQHIVGVDLLYHEATYLHELRTKAAERMHATAKEAGLIAKKAEVKKLIIGHYSSRYDDLTPLEDEARTEFEQTVLVRDGDVVELD